MTDYAEPGVEPPEGLTPDDRRRANRISVLAHRLHTLETITAQVESRGVQVGLPVPSGQVSVVPPVTLRGVEAERLLATMVDATKGELQALL